MRDFRSLGDAQRLLHLVLLESPDPDGPEAELPRLKHNVFGGDRHINEVIGLPFPIPAPLRVAAGNHDRRCVLDVGWDDSQLVHGLPAVHDHELPALLVCPGRRKPCRLKTLVED